MSGLDNFGAYQKALELFDHVVHDMAVLQKDSRCYRLVAQQVASADSVCANIEEGYGRSSRAEYVRFLDFARGSARETQGRYGRMKHWLDEETIRQRARLADEVIGILTSTIQHLRRDMQSTGRTVSSVREDHAEYEVGNDLPTLDTRPPTLPLSPSTPDTRHSAPRGDTA